MKQNSFRIVSVVLWIALLAAPASAENGIEAYRALGIQPADVLSGTVFNAQLMPGDAKQVVCMVTYLTGEKERATAVNVKLAVFQLNEQKLLPVYTRDFGSENSGNVGDSNLQIMDLNRNGLNDIVASYDDYSDPLIEQRVAEVIVFDENEFRTAWTGNVEYDATRAVRQVPAERRDRFLREIDIANTLRTRGITLFFNKKVISVAGERLPEPKLVQETFPLRAANQ